MLRLFLTIACLFAGMGTAFPLLDPRIAAQPPNGTIELHHDPTTSSWYLLASLNPDNYSDTYGSKTILGTHNPASTVTIFFTVEAYETVETRDDLHHIDAPLTAVYLYNVYQYCTPSFQCFEPFLDVNGTEPVGSGGGGNTINGEAYLNGLNVDLNYSFNIAGPEIIANWTGTING